jgi:hypothetical protein
MIVRVSVGVVFLRITLSSCWRTLRIEVLIVPISLVGSKGGASFWLSVKTSHNWRDAERYSKAGETNSYSG